MPSAHQEILRCICERPAAQKPCGSATGRSLHSANECSLAEAGDHGFGEARKH